MIKKIIRVDTFSMLQNMNTCGIYSINSIKTTIITFITAFFSLPESVFAQSDTANEPVTNSTTIEVDSGGLIHDAEQSDSFSHTITAEHLHLFSDRTIEKALARMSGVQSGRHGQFNIRGTSTAGRNLYNVTMNGQRMATTGKGNRSIDLGSISTDMVNQLEVVKVLTPDKDADAMGGLINITTRQPVEQQRRININYGGGFDSGYGDYIRPESRASIQYFEPFSEGILLSSGLTYQRNNYAWERLGIAYDVADFGNGYVDVIEGISPSFHTIEQINWGGHLTLDYEMTDVTSIYINSFFNIGTHDMTQHRTTMSANGDWINPFETGEAGRQGTYGYDIQIRDERVQQFMSQAGAKHTFNTMTMEHRFGWSNSNLHEDRILLPFSLTGLDYTIDMDDQTRPTMETVNGVIQRQNLQLDPMNEVKQEHVDNTFTGNIDFTMPFVMGNLRFGSGTILTYKDGDFRDAIFRTPGLNLSRFQLIDGGAFYVSDNHEYEIPWLLRSDYAKAFLGKHQPIFRRETDQLHENSDIWNYESFERIYSGYGMASWDFALFNVTGGVRVEHTEARYTGNDVQFNDIGFYRSTTDTTVNNSYTHFFPNLQLALSPTEQSSIMAAYSRSINRPDFHDVTPFRLLHEMNGTIFRGNSSLEPMISDNLDLFLEHYIGNTGHLSLGLFYKNLSNFVFERTRTIEGGEFDGFEERTYEIGDETAEVYGVEVSWQQQLWFLPGILGNLGVYTNYTWSHSAFDVEYRDEEVRLPGQSPYVVNAALNYIQGRFTGQIAYHWTAESIVHLAESQTPAPYLSGEIYRDRLEDGASDLSASVSFRISQNFRLWADVTNLLRDERVLYTESRSIYPVETDFRRNSVFRIGLRFDL